MNTEASEDPFAKRFIKKKTLFAIFDTYFKFPDN